MNLDAIAKLAAKGPLNQARLACADVSLNEVCAALNEWAELRPAVAVLSGLVLELRAWRSEHDCRYTLGATADIDGVHCPIDNPCVRCQRRLEWDAAQKELAELRAYRERTEAALQKLSAVSDYDMQFQINKPRLSGLGLWRDPAPKENA